MAIISYSGKIGAGKDLAGKITQALLDKPTCFDGMKVITEEDVDYKVWDVPKYSIKKWADSLKDILCIILNVSRKQIEDREFKESLLGPEWDTFVLVRKGGSRELFIYAIEEEAEKHSKAFKGATYVKRKQMTFRTLIQLLGTECGRNIIHPNIWVNALMSQYNYKFSRMDVLDMETKENHTLHKTPESMWVITDTRFPNEFKAVEHQGGVTIRVERVTELRFPKLWKDFQSQDKIDCWDDYLKAINKFKKVYHPSETALDNHKSDEVINNNGSVVDLVEAIKEILIKRKFI